MSFPRFRARWSEAIPDASTGSSQILQWPNCYYGSPTANMRGARPNALYETCSDYVNQGPPYKEGYEFLLKRLTQEFYDSESFTLQAGFYKYSGHFCIQAGTPSEVAAAYQGYGATAGDFGAEAFKKFRPVQPRVGLGQALGELRDFPSLFRLKLRQFKDLGGSYLNYQFGWRPFLKDILDFINTQKKIENHIRYVRNHNNKWIKRRGTLRDTTTTSSTSSIAGLFPALETAFVWPYPTGKPTVTRTLIVKDKIWFEAKMKYYIKDLNVDSCSSVWTSPLLRRLYGLEITPSLMWELTPWTWLTDWFVNIGDIYENFSNQAYDNLVAKYAYVMRTRETSVVYVGTRSTRMSPPICSGGRVTGYLPAFQGPTPIARAVFTAICKERARASQWGFGIEGDSISDRQLAILAALGISKGL